MYGEGESSEDLSTWGVELKLTLRGRDENVWGPDGEGSAYVPSEVLEREGCS